MRHSTRLVQVGLTLAVVLSIAAHCESAPLRPPQKLKAETVAAWVKAGAEFGYIRPDDDGLLGFHTDEFKPGCKDLPAFAITWPDLPYYSGLPGPEAPFALTVGGRHFDDTGDGPPPKEPLPDLRDIDVSNLLRVRHLVLSGGTEVEAGRLLHGLQRLTQLESLELAMSTKFLVGLSDSPAFPNLRTLSVVCGPTEEQLRAAGRLKQLTRLRVSSGGRIDPKQPGPHGRLIGLRHLAGLPALRSLYLDWCEVLTDEELAEVAKIPELRELSITSCVLITRKGLNALAGAKKLEGLDIAEGPATDGGWTEAAKMTGLRQLRIGGPAVSDAGLERIAAIPGLRDLTLKACDNVTDAGFAHLAAHRGLESLGLWFCRNLGEQGTKSIGGLKGLRHLRTGYCPGVTDKRLGYFANLLELRELDLRGCSGLTDAGIAKLTRFTKLEVLHLWVCPDLTEKCIPAIGKLGELRVLEFYMSDGVRPDDQDMKTLGELRKLQRLTLANCKRVTTDGYRAIVEPPELEEMGLTGCLALTDADLKVFAGHGRLKILVVRGSPEITDEGLRSLEPLALRKLWINECRRVTPDGIAAFSSVRPRCEVNFR